MALNTCEMWFNDIEIVNFFPKIAQRLEGFTPKPPQPQAAEDSAPRSPSVILTLAYSTRLPI